MARWQDYVLSGTRAAQPVATAVAIGTLYCVEDEDFALERSDGSAWDQYAPTGGSSGGSVVPATNGFRLTLSSGNPVYAPQRKTAASADTGTEIITFATDHGWTNGTIVASTTTAGGLTLGTRYYVHVVTSATITLHTTVATAISGASPVNITATGTWLFIPSGVSNTTIYFAPFSGSMIALYDGADWDYLSSAQVSLALGTLTADKNYDVFAYDNTGTLTLELSTAWTNATTRADAIELLNGVWVKTGATTRRLVGTIRTDTTTTTLIDSAGITTASVSGKAFVANVDNARPMGFRFLNATNSWANAGTVWRQINTDAAALIGIVVPIQQYPVDARAMLCGSNAAAGVRLATGIGIDSSTVNSATVTQQIYTQVANQVISFASAYTGYVSLGYHELMWLEYQGGTSTFIGDDGQGIFDASSLNYFQTGLMATVWI